MNQLRVLVIAYTFPPAGGAGVQRTAKFVKYLPEFGWLPTVLTVTESCYGVQDASHTDDFPDSIKIIRTAHFDPVARFTRLPAAASSVNHQGSDNGDRTIAKRSRKQALRAVAGKAWMTFDKTLLIPDVRFDLCDRRTLFGIFYSSGAFAFDRRAVRHRYARPVDAVAVSPDRRFGAAQEP
ncbi:MAG: hypothetical protein HY231_05415 [Acidobacteria bacterium]|nr:hypothetical protein [Acidobacteriota bacterium]